MLKKVTLIIFVVLLTFGLVNPSDSKATGKPSSKELSILQEKFRKIPVKYGNKTLYFKVTVKANYNYENISVSLNSISDKDLKVVDTYHGKYGTKATAKPLEKWAQNVIPQLRKLGSKYKYSWDVDVSNECDSYEPRTFSERDIRTWTGTCGYSFPLVFAGDGDYKYADILFSSRYKIKY